MNPAKPYFANGDLDTSIDSLPSILSERPSHALISISPYTLSPKAFLKEKQHYGIEKIASESKEFVRKSVNANFKSPFINNGHGLTSNQEYFFEINDHNTSVQSTVKSKKSPYNMTVKKSIKDNLPSSKINSFTSEEHLTNKILGPTRKIENRRFACTSKDQSELEAYSKDYLNKSNNTKLSPYTLLETQSSDLNKYQISKTPKVKEKNNENNVNNDPLNLYHSNHNSIHQKNIAFKKNRQKENENLKSISKTKSNSDVFKNIAVIGPSSNKDVQSNQSTKNIMPLKIAKNQTHQFVKHVAENKKEQTSFTEMHPTQKMIEVKLNKNNCEDFQSNSTKFQLEQKEIWDQTEDLSPSYRKTISKTVLGKRASNAQINSNLDETVYYSPCSKRSESLNESKEEKQSPLGDSEGINNFQSANTSFSSCLSYPLYEKDQSDMKEPDIKDQNFYFTQANMEKEKEIQINKNYSNLQKNQSSLQEHSYLKPNENIISNNNIQRAFRLTQAGSQDLKISLINHNNFYFQKSEHKVEVEISVDNNENYPEKKPTIEKLNENLPCPTLSKDDDNENEIITRMEAEFDSDEQQFKNPVYLADSDTRGNNKILNQNFSVPMKRSGEFKDSEIMPDVMFDNSVKYSIPNIFNQQNENEDNSDLFEDIDKKINQLKTCPKLLSKDQAQRIYQIDLQSSSSNTGANYFISDSSIYKQNSNEIEECIDKKSEVFNSYHKKEIINSSSILPTYESQKDITSEQNTQPQKPIANINISKYNPVIFNESCLPVIEEVSSMQFLANSTLNCEESKQFKPNSPSISLYSDYFLTEPNPSFSRILSESLGDITHRSMDDLNAQIHTDSQKLLKNSIKMNSQSQLENILNDDTLILHNSLLKSRTGLKDLESLQENLTSHFYSQRNKDSKRFIEPTYEKVLSELMTENNDIEIKKATILKRLDSQKDDLNKLNHKKDSHNFYNRLENQPSREISKIQTPKLGKINNTLTSIPVKRKQNKENLLEIKGDTMRGDFAIRNCEIQEQQIDKNYSFSSTHLQNNIFQTEFISNVPPRLKYTKNSDKKFSDNYFSDSLKIVNHKSDSFFSKTIQPANKL